MPVSLAVALGGALGALARYSLDRVLEPRTAFAFPWSTFAINVSGCLALGVIVAAFVDRHHAPAWLRVGLIVGALGGYTTFSTFAQETLDVVEARALGIALLYTAGSVVTGVVAVYVGAKLGRAL